ncbi:LD-carboxypeptidase [candidate division KSB1 bacterium]|nr:LD-carboxypeptidase [candidate division KSB1 bacterium]
MIKNIIKPCELKAGDKIGIISPASKPSDMELVVKGMDYLRSRNFEPLSGKYVFEQRGYLAGKDEDRITDLNDMFRSKDIKAIICSRGGYGAPRILDQLDFRSIKRNPKIFIGYSDITTLGLGIFARTGLVTFSGPMVAVEMGKGIHPFTEMSLWNQVLSPKDTIILYNPDDRPIDILKEGVGEGRLIVGCLSVMMGLFGTRYMPDLKGAILVIEDIDEDPYRIDRYFAQMKLSGVFNAINGLVLGQFIDCHPKDESKPSLSLEDVVWDYVKDLSIPIMAKFAYGHGEVKHTLPIGVQARVNTYERRLELLEPVLSC